MTTDKMAGKSDFRQACTNDKGAAQQPVIHNAVYCMIDDLDPARDTLIVTYLNALYMARVPVYLLTNKSLHTTFIPQKSSTADASSFVEIPSEAYSHASHLGLRPGMLGGIASFESVGVDMDARQSFLPELVADPARQIRALVRHDPRDVHFHKIVDEYLHGGTAATTYRPVQYRRAP